MKAQQSNKSNYHSITQKLITTPKKWLITGVAGFIGSNLLESLLKLGQEVVGLDNFSAGYQSNLDDVRNNVSATQWSNFTFIEGDIKNLKTCITGSANTDYVLHHAALCSVERSIQDPTTTSINNIDGFLNMLVAARDTGVKRFIYASSCAVYGDYEELPLVEEKTGDLLSPYAADKFVNEIHADLFSKLYNLNTIGLRYFNIFGPRQNSTSSYSSVMARWFFALIRNDEAYIYGDGKTTRDFCYIEDCIQANILAASTQNPEASNTVYNIGSGQNTDLNNLYKLINNSTAKVLPEAKNTNPIYQDFRPGDVRHSLADISRANKLLCYQPAYSLHEGLDKTAAWYLDKLK